MGTRLGVATEWATTHRGELSGLEEEFLRASIAAQEREAREEELRKQREIKVLQELAEEAEARRIAETEPPPKPSGVPSRRRHDVGRKGRHAWRPTAGFINTVGH